MVCMSVSEPAKHVPVSLLLNGCLDFGFIYLKNCFYRFPFLQVLPIVCVFLLLSARTLI